MFRSFEYILIKFERLIKGKDPARVLSVGYLAYMAIGFLLLCIPFSSAKEVSVLDNFFIAVSAVSTTGLATVDPGATYSFFGELIILFLIQLGGIGYMTFGSFVVLQTGHRISSVREEMTRATFPLPESLDIRSFLRGVVFFTLTAEILGAMSLSYFFYLEGFETPIWSGIFHSISAFCTAGFSLYSNSFENLSTHLPINIVISILSLLGAIGFIVVVDLWLRLTKRKEKILFTSKVIVLITAFFMLLGTCILYFTEPSIVSLPENERLLVAFFQTMTSSTTVGYSTISIDGLSAHVILLLYFFMLFGASPAGTGGGLKSTTFSALFGLVKSTLTKRTEISFWNRKIPTKRLQYAAAAFVFCMFVLGISVFFLCISENAKFDAILFEAVSALGTVGLSMGLTSNLTAFGKIVIIALMIIGRIGVLTFGLAISNVDSSELVESDVDLVM